MGNDTLFRAIAVAAAVALLAAPYWRDIAGWLAQAAQAARAHGTVAARIAGAVLIVAAAWGKIPLPSLPGVIDVPAIVVPEPSAEMQRLVEPVRAALAGLPPASRAVWAATWAKAALVVRAEGTTATPVLTDTPSLRLFTTVALDVAWRRIAGNAPGTATGLREAVEAAMRSALGLDAVPATDDVRARYADVANAIAWTATR